MTSNKNKPLNLLSEEELMALLDAPEVVEEKEEEITEYDNNVVPFLSHYKIVPGDKPISKKLLYKLYKAYVEEPLTNKAFQDIVGMFLDGYYNKKGGFYKINLDQFRIAKHIFEIKDKSLVKKDRSATYRLSFESFLESEGIKSGDKWLQGFVLHEIYLEYCRKKKKTKAFGYKAFHNMLKVYFKNQRKTQNRSLWFGVNEETANYYTKDQIRDIEARRSKKKG